MGFIGGLLGLNGGASGTGFAPPQSANILTGVDTGQANTAYGQTQQGLGSQQALLTALQGQNGLGLQNQAAQGFSNLANGVGPNPAQAQLNQNTAANVAQTGALMAGQRGASANPALMARQIGQQGAATQQQAVGQAATLQAQQQLQGLQGLAGQGNTIAGQQIGQTNANIGSQQAQYGNVLNALNALNANNVAMQSNVNASNAGLAEKGMGGQQGLVGGLMNLGSAAFKAQGGEVGCYDTGGPILGADTSIAQPAPQSMFGQYIAKVTAPNFAQKPQQAQPKTSEEELKQGVTNLGSAIFGLGKSRGGMVDVVVSPGEKILSPKQADKVAAGGKVESRTVPGKARVSGDSLENDTVPAKLPAGTIVVPRTKARDPKDFVQATLAKKRGKK